ncbi:MAG: hypothetical protein MI741_13305 [Rhodospirillales bacterium]|nr:hypothetical protein [Rhodospirillales bacterium]
MDGVIGAGAYSRQEYSRRHMQFFPDPARSEVNKNAPAGKSEQGIDPAAQAKPAAAPSLLVAVQEANLGRASDDEESDGPARLFAEKEQSEQDQLIEEILDVGFINWAHEQWLEKIREKARQSALASMGLTEDDVANMAPQMQEQIERLIEEIVEAAIRSATGETAENTDSDETNEAAVVNPIITGN